MVAWAVARDVLIVYVEYKNAHNIKTSDDDEEIKKQKQNSLRNKRWGHLFFRTRLLQHDGVIINIVITAFRNVYFVCTVYYVNYRPLSRLRNFGFFLRCTLSRVKLFSFLFGLLNVYNTHAY